MPKDLPKVDLTENARQVLIKRYVRRGNDGQPAETVEEMFWRVAYNIALVEEKWASDVTALARKYYVLLNLQSLLPQLPHLHRRRHSPRAARRLLCPAHR